jgi:hypothetical protein
LFQEDDGPEGGDRVSWRAGEVFTVGGEDHRAALNKGVQC